jgi:hypothetical protein
MTDAEHAECLEWIRNAERQLRESEARTQRDKARFECTERAISSAMGLYIAMLEGQLRAIWWGLEEVERRRSEEGHNR